MKMLKPKELAKLTEDELKETYTQACATLIEKLEAFEFQPERPWDWYNGAEAAWTDVKRCQQQLILRHGRKRAEEYWQELQRKEQEGGE